MLLLSLALTGRSYACSSEQQCQTQAEFFQGYYDAGGPPEYELRVLGIIECESRWRIDPGNPAYLGLAQFDPGTWEMAGGGDWRDPYQQGYNFWIWLVRTGWYQWGCK